MFSKFTFRGRWSAQKDQRFTFFQTLNFGPSPLNKYPIKGYSWYLDLLHYILPAIPRCFLFTLFCGHEVVISLEKPIKDSKKKIKILFFFLKIQPKTYPHFYEKQRYNLELARSQSWAEMCQWLLFLIISILSPLRSLAHFRLCYNIAGSSIQI